MKILHCLTDGTDLLKARRTLKSLLDIQQDVRNLESNVQEITKRIKALNSDIADIRNAEDNAEYEFHINDLLATNRQW